MTAARPIPPRPTTSAPEPAHRPQRLTSPAPERPVARLAHASATDQYAAVQNVAVQNAAATILAVQNAAHQIAAHPNAAIQNAAIQSAPAPAPEATAPNVVAPQRARGYSCSVRPAPRREPAFDDEPLDRHLHLVRAAAAPELPFPVAPRPTAPTPRRLTLVPTQEAMPSPTCTPDRRPGSSAPAGSGYPAPAGAPVTVTRRSPDPARFSRQFAVGAIEALSGRRPMVQLSRHVSPAVQRGLARTADQRPIQGGAAPSLHSLHVSEPADGVCEMSAIFVVGPRYRALAARLEWKIDHWRCTALQVG